MRDVDGLTKSLPIQVWKTFALMERPWVVECAICSLHVNAKTWDGAMAVAINCAAAHSRCRHCGRMS